MARQPLIRQGEGTAGLARLERERIAQERKIEKICDECGPVAPNGRALAKPGDPRVLRAIPVIARGVEGAAFGTRPDREVIRRLSR